MANPADPCVPDLLTQQAGISPSFFLDFPFLLPFLAVYLFAGLQTWRLLFALDPDNRFSPLGLALRRDDPSVYVILYLFLLVWPVFLAGAWLAVRFASPRPS